MGKHENGLRLGLFGSSWPPRSGGWPGECAQEQLPLVHGGGGRGRFPAHPHPQMVAVEVPRHGGLGRSPYAQAPPPPHDVVCGLGFARPLYTSDAADEEDSVDLGGRRIIKKKKKKFTYITSHHSISTNYN